MAEPSEIVSIIRDASSEIQIHVVDSRAALQVESESMSADDVLIAFGTSIIVSGQILGRVGAAYNFHAASPDYPGRDPHHFAIYDKAKRYGATAHVMTTSVDSGPIVGVEWFDVPAGVKPLELLELANRAAIDLMYRLIPQMLYEEPLRTLENVRWCGKRRSRQDFLNLCVVPGYIERDELHRRLTACEASGYKNLQVELHGYRFRIESICAASMASAESWVEYTESNYSNLLRKATERYVFRGYEAESSYEGPRIILRHNVRMSVHRAHKLATIEGENGVKATYCFSLTSPFYSLRDDNVLDRARAIVSMGHHIGMLVDTSFEQLIASLSIRCEIQRQWGELEELLSTRVGVVCIEPIGCESGCNGHKVILGDCTSVLPLTLLEGYQSCCDCGGEWRGQSLAGLLYAGTSRRIHTVVHPEWWTPEPMAPRERVERCVLGRAHATMQRYEQSLEIQGAGIDEPNNCASERI